MFSRSILKMFLFATILLAVVASASAAAPPNEEAQNSVGSIHTYLMPDLSLKSVFPDLLPRSETLVPQAGNFAGGRPKRGFCQCSCGFQCATDADCGGSSCDPFITCCARKGQGSDAEWFRSSQASHKTAVPEAILKADCK